MALVMNESIAIEARRYLSWSLTVYGTEFMGGFMGISTVPPAHVQPRENGMLIYDSRPLRSSISPRVCTSSLESKSNV